MRKHNLFCQQTLENKTNSHICKTWIPQSNLHIKTTINHVLSHIYNKLKANKFIFAPVNYFMRDHNARIIMGKDKKNWILSYLNCRIFNCS